MKHAASGKKARPNFNGRRPKGPVMIAPRYLAMFTDIKRARRRAFLAAYVQEGGDFRKTTKAMSGGWSHTKWLREDADYRAAFERAKRMVAEAAERKVCRRAGRRALSNAKLMSILRNLRRGRYAPSGKKPK